MNNRRRNGAPPESPPGGSGHGFDEANWQILCEAVAAAHRGDADAVAVATRRFDTDVPVDGRAGIYIWWLLRYRVAQMLGRRPSRGDITQIAGYAEARFGVVVRDVELLKNVLLTVWKLATPTEEVKAGIFLLAGTTALGVLLTDPAAELNFARPELATWWQQNKDSFRSQGLLEDRRGSRSRRPR